MTDTGVSLLKVAVDELPGLVGRALGTSDWLTVSQQMIDQFAEATGDHQWIHVDPVAAASGPFGTTVAHGYLTLSLVPTLLKQLISIECSQGVNYGADKIRFPSPVPAGSRARLACSVDSVLDVGRGCQVGWLSTIEVDGQPKPACVALVRYLYFR